MQDEEKKVKWVNVHKKRPKPYQLVECKGIWTADKVLYLDDGEEGWEQKKKGLIEVTHWRSGVKKAKRAGK